MQQSQLNFAGAGTKSLVLISLLALAQPGFAGTIAHPTPKDSLLDPGPTSPCAAGADYVPGADANGRDVVPADVGQPPVPVPDSVAIPLHTGQAGGRSPRRNGEGPYAMLDGRRLAPLLNSPPCR